MIRQNFFDKLQENVFALVTIQKILVLKTSAPIPEEQERNIKTENCIGDGIKQPLNALTSKFKQD